MSMEGCSGTLLASFFDLITIFNEQIKACIIGDGGWGSSFHIPKVLHLDLPVENSVSASARECLYYVPQSCNFGI
jgi:hypothetical protein